MPYVLPRWFWWVFWVSGIITLFIVFLLLESAVAYSLEPISITMKYWSGILDGGLQIVAYVIHAYALLFLALFLGSRFNSIVGNGNIEHIVPIPNTSNFLIEIISHIYIYAVIVNVILTAYIIYRIYIAKNLKTGYCIKAWILLLFGPPFIVFIYMGSMILYNVLSLSF